MNRKTSLLFAASLATVAAIGAFRVLADDKHDHDHDHDHSETAVVTTQPSTKPQAAEEEPDHKHDDGHDHGPAEAKKGDAHDHDHDHPANPKKADEHAHAEGESHDHDHPVEAKKPDGHDHDHAHDHSTDTKKPDEHGHAHGDSHGHGHDHAEGSHSDEVKLTPEAIQRHDIRTAPVAKVSLAASFAAPARVAFNAEAMAHVGSSVTGRATALKARVGDVVKQGDELIAVESPELGEAQSDYLQKRAAVAVAAVAVEPAKNAAERAVKLFEKNQSIALAEVQKREAESVAAQRAVQTAQAGLDAAANKLKLLGLDEKAVEGLSASNRISPHFAIRAPIAGTVIERETTLGELVSPEKHALLVLADVSTVWVVADVTEARLGEVRPGWLARVRVASQKAPIEGKVTYIASVLDTSTRTAEVRIEVPNADGTLKPGMFARADLSPAPSEDAGAVLAVPEEALQTVEGKPAVFVPVDGEPNTFAAKPVQIGRAAGGMVPVESGLKEGDRVVVNGAFILKADLGKAGAAHEH